MYGLINQAIRGLVLERFGTDAWQRICVTAGVEEGVFVAMQPYDDAVTYDLVGAASKELGLPAEAILETFGAYWVEYVGQENYGELMDAAGKDLPEFLENLDQMHARVMLSFPDLKPPSFRVSDRTDKGLLLHYYSSRPGLAPLVVGLLNGLAARFGRQIEVEHRREADGQGEHDVFGILFRTPST